MELLRHRRIVLYISILLNLHSVCLLTAVGANPVSFNSPLSSKLGFSSKEYRRLKGKGVEMMPIDEIASNTIGEPSCEELRAMWRYNKRQHRAAELSNQIPALPNMFWDVPVDQPRSFGMFRSRGSHSFRPKGSKNRQAKIFGRLTLSPAATREPASQRVRPLDQVTQLLAKDRPVKVSNIKEPVVHLTEPVEPTPESSFRKLKNMYREERMRDGNNGKNSRPTATQSPPGSSSSSITGNVTPPTALAGGREFGRLVLAPPKGQDGRIANKPKELMSPFERLRFGQVDDLLGIKDEIEGKHILTNFPVKRRTGFVPMLRQFGATTGSRPALQDGGRNFGDLSSTVTQTFGFRPPHLGSSSRSLPVPVSLSSVSAPNQPNLTYSSDDVMAAAFEDSFYAPGRDSVLMRTNVGDLQVQNAIESIPGPVVGEGQALLVETPSCPEVEHQFCETNIDCKCAGYGLYRCFHGQCQILTVYPEDTDDYDLNGGSDAVGDDGGLWHTNSISNSHLGLWDSGPFVDSILNVDEMKKRFA